MIRSSNPALSDRVFSNVRGIASDQVMTLDGTVNRTIVALLMTYLAAWWTYNNPAAQGLMIPAIIAALVIYLVLLFKPASAPYTVPIYALAEGVVLGALSWFFDSLYNGIVLQAVSLTGLTFFSMLFVYKSGWIKVTAKLRVGITAAVGAVFLLYLSQLVLGLFGTGWPFLSGSGPFALGISAVIVVIAAVSLLLDFDFIERQADSKSAPKFMEWYGAFALLVTLIWLYVEMLRLLAILKGRD